MSKHTPHELKQQLAAVRESVLRLREQIGAAAGVEEALLLQLNPHLSLEQVRVMVDDHDKAELKAYYEKRDHTLAVLGTLIKVDTMWQDHEGVVWKLVVPDGRYVKFDRLAVHRTRREGEKAGTLSLTDAREAGFNVEGKTKNEKGARD